MWSLTLHGVNTRDAQREEKGGSVSVLRCCGCSSEPYSQGQW